jgi:3-hydroxyisobutyrate dehydrogenase-like beta-hydroxyacid dehydrogenase
MLPTCVPPQPLPLPPNPSPSETQPLAVYNRTASKAASLAAAAPPGAAAPAASPAAAALGGAEIIHVMLADDSACDSVIAQLLEAAPGGGLAGKVVVNHSTAHPDCARRAAAALACAGADYVAAPVFGRRALGDLYVDRQGRARGGRSRDGWVRRCSAS